MTQIVPPIPAAVSAFFPLSEVKVWSLIVTILGDLAPHDGQGVEGPVLTALVERMGVQPQAMRVALHRLRKDAWIDSDKQGRVVTYRLSAMARTRTQEAQSMIYGGVTRSADLWINITAPDHAADGFAIAPRVIVADHIIADALVMRWTGDALPAWVVAQIEQSAIVERHAGLVADLGLLRQSLGQNSDVMARTVLRLIVLHRWRRIILRTDPRAMALLPMEAAPHHCRALVAEVLSACPRPHLADLAAALAEARG